MFTNGSGMKKTNIQMLLGVRYPRFMEYLEWLVEHKLVEEIFDEEKSERIKLTPKGIESYHTLVEWIRETLDGKVMTYRSTPPSNNKKLRENVFPLGIKSLYFLYRRRPCPSVPDNLKILATSATAKKTL